MKIRFVGAIDHITGSCSWLQCSETGEQFLVDCGMYQGPQVEPNNKQEFPFDPAKIKFVLLTHAHIDHCGLIPKLYRDGFRGKVYATAATAKLADIGLRDAANIQKQNEPVIYESSDVDRIEFVKVDEDNVNFIHKDNGHFYWGAMIWSGISNVQVVFLRSSHILGAVSITVNWKSKKGEVKNMCFSGDIGNNTDAIPYLPLIKSNQYPFPTANYILVESTYGHKSREKKYKCAKNRQDELWRIVSEAQNRGGKLLIPVFSIHRPQEILVDFVAMLKKYSESDKCWKILCQSPMIAKVSQVYHEELGRTIKNKNEEDKKLYMRDDLLDYIEEKNSDVFKHLFNTMNENYEFEEMTNKDKLKSRYKFMERHSIDIIGHQPNNYDEYDIIVASSGMCAAGPIRKYLNEYENDPKNTILLTGYQASKEGQKIQRISKNTAEKNYAKVESMGQYYSGHADQEVLLDYIFQVDAVSHETKITPATIFINHGGNADSKNALKSAIEKQDNNKCRQRPIGKVIVAEKLEQWFDLNSGQLEEITNADIMREIRAVQQTLRTHERQLQQLCNKRTKT